MKKKAKKKAKAEANANANAKAASRQWNGWCMTLNVEDQGKDHKAPARTEGKL
jgi:hypothetical protein